MATNEKTAKESKAVAKPAPSKTVKPVDKEVVAAVRDTADNVAKVYSAMQADEAARDAAIDQMEAELDEHLDMLEQKGVSYEKREEIRARAEARIDKRRQYNLEHKKENTKRWNGMLWAITFSVIGWAAFKYGPDIINELMKHRRI